MSVSLKGDGLPTGSVTRLYVQAHAGNGDAVCQLIERRIRSITKTGLATLVDRIQVIAVAAQLGRRSGCHQLDMVTLGERAPRRDALRAFARS